MFTAQLSKLRELIFLSIVISLATPGRPLLAQSGDGKACDAEEDEFVTLASSIDKIGPAADSTWSRLDTAGRMTPRFVHCMTMANHGSFPKSCVPGGRFKASGTIDGDFGIVMMGVKTIDCFK